MISVKVKWIDERGGREEGRKPICNNNREDVTVAVREKRRK